ncbi:MAG: 6-phosphogluconolactonase, partial [Gemmatimonadetes bacterium]|nr:6-phosphogluconolactonase [Gemmatimonadota bacterium]
RRNGSRRGGELMREERLPDAEAVARRAAELVAASARRAVSLRGRFLFAVSGGTTPWRMLHHLAEEAVPWEAVHLFQVDERIAPAGDPDRNWTHVTGSLLVRLAEAPAGLHPMPVELPDADRAAAAYAETLHGVAGAPPELDLIHLGLGSDGHTASLLPRDPVLAVEDRDVAVTGEYAGRKRVTLTYPVLNGAERILWIVTGDDKAAALGRLRSGDGGIPAAGVRRDRAFLLTDQGAG